MIFGGLFLALVGIGIVGCKKDSSILNSTENNGLISKSNVTSRNGVLLFGGWDDAFVFMNEVVDKNELHVNTFYSLYNNFSDDELDSIQEVTGWEYNQAYIDIENQFQYKSLLTYVDDKLYKDELNNEERNYWNQFLVEDDFGAILNHESVVQIGDSMYKFLQNMLVVAVSHEELQLLRQINDDNFEMFLDNTSVKIHGHTLNKAACRANRQTFNQTWWNATGGSRTLKGWIIVRNIASGAGGSTIRYVRAKTKAERFQNGKNRRWKTNISAATQGTIFRNNSPFNCQGKTESCYTSKQSNAHTLTSTYKNQTIWQLLIFRARVGEVKSTHQAPGGYLDVLLN